ncbi:hypothetical protein, partial [Bacillus altitudinis]|uniref:hypothetical protein n=1 Tax=Bacillus altitudinis TaxID=293387 RepID=UPI001C9319E4
CLSPPSTNNTFSPLFASTTFNILSLKTTSNFYITHPFTFQNSFIKITNTSTKTNPTFNTSSKTSSMIIFIHNNSSNPKLTI